MQESHRIHTLDLGGKLTWQIDTGSRQRRNRVQRNRHGRAPRGILVPSLLPRFRTRRQNFDELVIQEVRNLLESCPDLNQISFGVEDVPPSDPAPWEHSSVVLGRGFGADPAHGLPNQVVLYRRPIEQRAKSFLELREIVHAVVLEQSAQLLSLRPEEIDPDWY